jgi:hypothetical protein
MAEVDADAEEAPDASELPDASASAEMAAATDDQAAAVWRVMRESKGILNPEEARRKVSSRKQSMLHSRCCTGRVAVKAARALRALCRRAAPGRQAFQRIPSRANCATRLLHALYCYRFAMTRDKQMCCSYCVAIAFRGDSRFAR